MTSLCGENRADGGADHGVAHTHDVEARDALANVGVHAFEVVEDGFLPKVPILVEQELAVLSGRTFRESPIEGPDSAVDVRAKTLVSGVDVTEGGGV